MQSGHPSLPPPPKTIIWLSSTERELGSNLFLKENMAQANSVDIYIMHGAVGSLCK